jgi:hypothetical protein
VSRSRGVADVLDDYSGTVVVLVIECASKSFDAFACSSVRGAEADQHHLILSMIDDWRKCLDQ